MCHKVISFVCVPEGCSRGCPFVVVDHELLRITSANFSYSAENRNAEFGILVRDTALATPAEAAMPSKHGSLYELINT